jgi:hypothetical protein
MPSSIEHIPPNIPPAIYLPVRIELGNAKKPLKYQRKREKRHSNLREIIIYKTERPAYNEISSFIGE